MRRKDLDIRINKNKKATELIQVAMDRKLTNAEIEELKTLHTGYGGISDNTQYFTPEEVVQYMIDSLDIFIDISKAKILEPSCGNGIFLRKLYEKNSMLDITGVELNRELYLLNKICYEKATIIEANTLDYLEDFKEKFDIVIGNPPFGATKSNPEFPLSQNRLEAQFVELSLKALKPGGHFIMVLPTSILSANSYIPLRQKILDNFMVIQSVELPDTTFCKSNTNVTTSILHLMKIKNTKKTYETDYNVLMSTIEKIGFTKKGDKCENQLENLIATLKEHHNKIKSNIDILLKE